MSSIMNGFHEIASGSKHLIQNEQIEKVIMKSWANGFSEIMIPAIHPKRFTILYNSTNESDLDHLIQVMVGALILKEIQDLSDYDLITNILCDIRYQYALHISDYTELPMNVYSLCRFRERLYLYTLETGQDLFQEEMESLADVLVKYFDMHPSQGRIESSVISLRCNQMMNLEILVKTVLDAVKKVEPTGGVSMLKSIGHYFTNESWKDKICDLENVDILSMYHAVINDAAIMIDVIEDSGDNSVESQLLRRVIFEQSIRKEADTSILQLKESMIQKELHKVQVPVDVKHIGTTDESNITADFSNADITEEDSLDSDESRKGKKGKRKKRKKEIEDVLLNERVDRRLLSNVPDPTGERVITDRRNVHGVVKEAKYIKKQRKSVSDSLPEHEGIRYEAEISVLVTCWSRSGVKYQFECNSVDISSTGILLNVVDEEHKDWLSYAKKIKLKFEIEQGSMPEGYEMKVNIKACLTREFYNEKEEVFCGLIFQPSLAEYIFKKRGSNLRVISILFLLVLVLTTILMRTGNFLYFRFNKLIYLYSIVTAFFLLSRYLFGALYKPVPVNPDFTPGVSIIIPCFNEEEWIQRTILSCLNQDYPADRLEVIIVDDCSNDKSIEKIKEIVEKCWEQEERYQVKDRLNYMQMKQNAGKRDALAAGLELTHHELIVFVDSDSFLDPYAIRNLVQPFQDPKMGGVTGRTDVANTYTNGLTKMQSVRYYIAFRIMKAAEAYFDSVTCLSGPISCYRKSIMEENVDAWLNQSFLGQKATFGDDRAMTNFVLRKYRTTYQDTAICSTIVPNTHKQFLKQQMRWKRSWLRESSIAASFIWKKEPFMALSFYMGYIIPMIAPIIVTMNLIIIPITQRVFPITFIMGLFIMSMLMSMSQLFFRRSSTWPYGIWFCLYYVLVLMWQMPVAWVTFWKSTWGTRMTPADIKADEKKKRRKEKRERKAGKISEKVEA